MRPEGDAAKFPDDDEVAQDDRRRVRAVAQSVLREAADDGHTVLELPDLMDRIIGRFPDRRACRPDREIMAAERSFYEDVLWTTFEGDPQLVALKDLQDLEQNTASAIKRRVKKTNEPSTRPITWSSALRRNFGEPDTLRAKAALNEKEKALGILFERRLSVLTGGAGTGKTSLLNVFLTELEKSEGRQPALLLAPTGKARVRLSTTTHRNAMTIHQVLLKQGWLMRHNFQLKAQSKTDSFKATTVVIDECSMIPADLFGTVLKALDSGPLKRLILVGDPNQLPPIGPGRPFIDVIDWLEKQHPECVASLEVSIRTTKEGAEAAGESAALKLAEGYRTDVASPADDEILAAIAQGRSQEDLEIAFWEDRDDLLIKLKNKMADHFGFEDRDYRSFNQSLGIDTKDWKRSEAWQILSPSRNQQAGVNNLNRLIQLEYKGGLIATCKRGRNNSPRPFGEQEIVVTDKVIQISNK
jgi:exodeoxyribonuclease V alpha subunit